MLQSLFPYSSSFLKLIMNKTVILCLLSMIAASSITYYLTKSPTRSEKTTVSEKKDTVRKTEIVQNVDGSKRTIITEVIAETKNKVKEIKDPRKNYEVGLMLGPTATGAYVTKRVIGNFKAGVFIQEIQGTMVGGLVVSYEF